MKENETSAVSPSGCLAFFFWPTAADARLRKKLKRSALKRPARVTSGERPTAAKKKGGDQRTVEPLGIGGGNLQKIWRHGEGNKEPRRQLDEPGRGCSRP